MGGTGDSQGSYTSIAIALYSWLRKIAVASSLWRLEVGLSVQTRVISQTRCPGSDFKVKTVKSKGVPHLEA
jgi:hypothetical protein